MRLKIFFKNNFKNIREADLSSRIEKIQKMQNCIRFVIPKMFVSALPES